MESAVLQLIGRARKNSAILDPFFNEIDGSIGSNRRAPMNFLFLRSYSLKSWLAWTHRRSSTHFLGSDMMRAAV